MKYRLLALDAMRGIVMLLMLVDHTSSTFNADRVTPDSALFPAPEGGLDPLQYGVRWITHLCAPTFVFLAGTSLALSVERRVQSGVRAGPIDRDLLVRGALIAAVDLSLITWLWGQGMWMQQVMFAIGASLVLMIGLRRLPSLLLCVLALASWIAGEWTRTGDIFAEAGWSGAARASLLNGGLVRFESGGEPFEVLGHAGLFALYPLLPWAGVMAAGWVFGRRLVARGAARDVPAFDPRVAVRMSLFAGAALLAVFALVRWTNDFGNQGLPRADDSLLEWLRSSKYPPSLGFLALHLGLMFLLLAGLFAVEGRRGLRSGRWNPVVVFGQTAFFFYVAHITLVEGASRALGMHRAADLTAALVAALAVGIALYPSCLAYRAWKARHPRSVLRYF